MNLKVVLALSFILFTFPCLAQEQNPLFVITVDEKQGYIDKTGKIVIQPQFEQTGYADSGDFSEGLAVVKMNGKWGYIDKTGKIVIKPQFLTLKYEREQFEKYIGNELGGT